MTGRRSFLGRQAREGLWEGSSPTENYIKSASIKFSLKDVSGKGEEKL